MTQEHGSASTLERAGALQASASSDFGHYIGRTAGCMLLADQGAEVIKVKAQGDPARVHPALPPGIADKPVRCDRFAHAHRAGPRRRR